MGKKDSKKGDLDKKQAKKARQAAKQAKSALKRNKKETKDGEDIEKIIREFNAKEAAKTAVTVEVTQPPSRRSNFSLTPLPNGEVVIYGGEYFDGEAVTVYSDVYRWNIDKGEWKHIQSLNTPPPRCAHQAVFVQDRIYMFGGEYATTDQFYHYKDLWCLDLKTNVWREIKANGDCPSPRSGHRLVVWRNVLILFGGFYEAMRETRFFSDLYFYFIAEERWVYVGGERGGTNPNAHGMGGVSAPGKAGGNGVWPSPRSGSQVVVYEDTLYLFGGYFKDKKGGGKVLSDLYTLPLRTLMRANASAPLLDVSKVNWVKGGKKGETPSPRVGGSVVLYKNKALMFGGVYDKEEAGHTLVSTFYNDLFAYDLERGRWYKLGLKKSGAGSGSRRKKAGGAAKGEDGDIGDESGDDEGDVEVDVEDGDGDDVGGEESNKADMFGYIDELGNVVYLSLQDEGEGDVEVEGKEVKVEEVDVQLSLGDVKISTIEEDAPTQAAVVATAPTPAPTPAQPTFNHQTHTPPPAVAPQVNNTNIPQQSWKTQFLLHAQENLTHPAPYPRMNASLFIKAGKLHVFGGITEVTAGSGGDVEVALDDCYVLDLSKRVHWVCVLPGSMDQLEWKGEAEGVSECSGGASDDEDEGSDGSSDGEESDEDGESSEESDGDDEDDKVGKEKASSSSHKKDKHSSAAPAAASKSTKRSGVREEMEQLRVQFDLEDANRTPIPGEALRAFYSRTAEFWASQVIAQYHASTESNGSSPVLSEKEIKKMGFALSEERYNELLPILSRLQELEEQQREEEEERGGMGGRGGRGRGASGKDSGVVGKKKR